MADIKRIIALIDSYLEMKGLDYVEPNEVSKHLEQQGVLSYSTKGQPLRKLLREGLIPSASQPSGNRWIIRHSGNRKGIVKRVETSKVLSATVPVPSTSREMAKGLAPVGSANAEILILGTLPGNLSLEKDEYYAHPGNQFWRIIASLFNEALPNSYMAKLAILERHQIALWDVFKSAERASSLDADIRNSEPNDIIAFFSDHPKLRILGFNGKTAMELFQKHISFNNIPGNIQFIELPSTSPSNTHCTLEDKVKRWSAILK